MTRSDLCFKRVTAQQTSEDSMKQGIGSTGGENDKTGETSQKRNDRTGYTLHGRSNHEKSIQRDRCDLPFLAWVENDATSFPRLKSQEENLACQES